MDNTLKELIFSRQFLLGPRPFIYTDQWKATNLTKNFILSTHPNLEVEIKTVGTGTLVLLGYIIDPFNPAKTSADVLNDISEKITNVPQVIDSTTHLSGRWVMIFLGSQGPIIFTDPCSMRQVYYHVNKDGLWCGSQPELIKTATDLTPNTDKDLSDFIKSFDYRRKENALVGDKTRYSDCYHLLPNHFLDLLSALPIRFFPQKKPSPLSVDQAVELASSVLRGSMEAISQRFPVMLAVTAGWDTRVLLASTKSISDRFEFYVDRQGVFSVDHPDVHTPQLLCRRLKINFRVRNSSEDPPRWFLEILSQSVSGARLLPKTRMIYATLANGLKSINVNGNGSEICRNAYDGFGLIAEDNITAGKLTGLIGYYKSKFVEKELSDWKANLEKTGTFGYHILDLFYWEQGMANWGSQYAAEQDVAIEDFSPFNNRLLLTTLLSLPREYRSGPHFPIYTKLIERMWPEALAEPINPANFLSRYIHFYFYHLPIPIWARLKLIRFALKSFLKTIKMRLKRLLQRK